jgi:hypothetical protein
MEQQVSDWRKSSYSGSANTGNCVEVGQVAARVAVRDTKNKGNGPVLRISSADWSRFVKSLPQALAS